MSSGRSVRQVRRHAEGQAPKRLKLGRASEGKGHRDARPADLQGTSGQGAELLRQGQGRRRNDRHRRRRAGDAGRARKWMRGCSRPSGPDLPETASVVREEIFGPCCHISAVRFSEAEVDRARPTTRSTACATAIWTRDPAAAPHRVAGEDRSRHHLGEFSWFLRDLRTPFGGSKQSGIGREGGVHSLEFYTELRNVCIKYA